MCLFYHVGSRESVTLNMLCYLFWLIFPFMHALGCLTMTEWRDAHQFSQSFRKKLPSIHTLTVTALTWTVASVWWTH